MACSDPTVKSQCGKSTRTPNNLCCPTCGAVECLCRPRFFAGQLLSEQDLNRLDQYIKNKNRLHVRNLNGWGVVNGLKVLCDPCGAVKVTEGYAVNPCGDDIVVCAETAVDICALIRQCKQTRMSHDCRAPNQNSTNNNRCEDVEEEWVLTIQYEEWPSRGITPLRGSSCNTHQCACGGSSGNCSCGKGKTSGSCGCSSKSSAISSSVSASKAPRGASTECEATVICESFSFDIYRKPVPETRDDDDERLLEFSGSFADAFNCCASTLIATMPPMPNLQDDDNVINYAAAISKWCCTWRKNLIDYFLTHPNTSCEVIDFLQKVDCPSLLRPASFATDFYIAFLSLLAAWAEGLKVCLCLALLPPTPDASCDLRVPLATVRVRSRDCKVLSICNWTTERKMMVTWPAVGHWLGILPIGDFLRELLDTICCNSLLGIFDRVTDRFVQDQPDPDHSVVAPMNLAAEASAPHNNAETNGDNAPDIATPGFAKVLSQVSRAIPAELTLGSINRKSANFAQFIGASLERGTRPLELGALLNNVSPRFKLPTNKQSLSDIEASNIPLLLLAEMVVKPVATSVLGEQETKAQMRKMHSAQRDSSKKSVDANSQTTTAKADNLQRQLDSLKQQLDEQAKTISAFKKQLNPKK